MSLTIPSCSTEYVRVEVSATQSGQPIDPTSGSPSMAFTAVGAEPDSGDWNPAAWDTTSYRGIWAIQCLIGPGGVTLVDGEYQVWWRVQLDEEDVQRPAAGTLTIT